MVPQLPIELLLVILEPLTIAPNSNETFIGFDDEPFDVLMQDFRESLPARRALPQVSRTFNVLATPFLYSCICLGPQPVPDALVSLDSSKAKLVRHVIMNIAPVNQPIPEDSFVSLFALLPNVHTLSIHMQWIREWTDGRPPLFEEGLLARTMAESLGPTLRKLVLYEHSLMLFQNSDLKPFMSSLIHLEALTSRYISMSDDDLLPSAISPALTHLSLFIPSLSFFDAYRLLSTACPNLASLSLSGFLSDVIRVLTEHPFPAVAQLDFPSIWQLEEATLMEIIDDDDEAITLMPEVGWREREIEAWTNALLGLQGPPLMRVRVMDGKFIRRLEEWTKSGQVDISGLEQCGFTVEDGGGRVLLDVIRTGYHD